MRRSENQEESSLPYDNPVPIPAELVSRLRKTQDTWFVNELNALTHGFMFDSRTEDWEYVLAELCKSSIANQEILVDLFIECSPRSEDLPTQFLIARTGNDAFTAMEKSPYCIKVEEIGGSYFKARMAPLGEALMFINQLYRNPPASSAEAQFYPVGCYVRTMFVHTSGLFVKAHMHRG